MRFESLIFSICGLYRGVLFILVKKYQVSETLGECGLCFKIFDSTSQILVVGFTFLGI